MDIKVLLYQIKENIKVIEEGNYDYDVLNEIQTDFLELLELIKLFLISERDSYYGYFMMNMQFCVNFRSNIIASIKLNEFPPVFESNPLLLCKFTLNEIIYVVCHEIDHVVLNHPAEMVKANPTKDENKFYEFNLAADASVNDRINHEIKTEGRKFLVAPKGLITSTVLEKMFSLRRVKPLENYIYYLNLISGKQQNEESFGNGQSSMMYEQNEKDGINQNNSSDSYTDDSIVTASNCGELVDHNWEAGDDAEDAAAVVKEFVNATTEIMNEETRGMMPAYFLSQIELINKPAELSWKVILKKYIGTISANKRKTRMRLNRRQPERFDLPGRVDDKVLKIIVAIDTSASVDDEMIARIFNEIFEILAKRKHDITVIECDSKVQRVYKAKTISDIKTKVNGRGGTCFQPVIKYINKNKYYRDALLIYFTDGYGEDEISKPNTYRNIWVVFDDERNLSLKEPYGAVLKL